MTLTQLIILILVIYGGLRLEKYLTSRPDKDQSFYDWWRERRSK